MSVSWRFADEDACGAGSRCVDVPSSWRQRKWQESDSASAQTEPVNQETKATQSVTRKEFSCQTSPSEFEEKNEGNGCNFTKYENDRDFADFCRSAGDLMVEQLQVKTKAFDFIGDSFDYHQSKDRECKTIHELGAILSDVSRPGLNCTSVAWTATGSQVVAAYGRYDVCGWDESLGCVRVWNIFRRKMNPQKADLVLDCETSVLSVACHPVWPAFVVAGTYNGDIKMWDLSFGGDPLVSSSAITDYTHRGPVVRLRWVRKTAVPGRGLAHRGEDEYLLASLSSDGLLLFWNVDKERGTKLPLRGFRVGGSKRAHPGSSRGASSISFSAPRGRQTGAFVVGADGGKVNRCFLGSAINHNPQKEFPNWTEDAAGIAACLSRNDKLRLKGHVEKYTSVDRGRPVTAEAVFRSKPGIDIVYPSLGDFSYEKHAGPVYGVSCSPFHRNLFITASADGNVRLHSMLLQRPVCEAMPSEDASCYLYDAAWSPTRPTVFATCSSTGSLCVFDLSAPGGMNEPAVTLQAGGERGAPVFCLAFNPKTRGIIATGDADGMLRIHKIGWALSNELPGDQIIVQTLAQFGLDVAADDDDQGAEGEEKRPS